MITRNIDLTNSYVSDFRGAFRHDLEMHLTLVKIVWF